MGDSSRRTTYTRRITAADRSSVEVMGKQAPTGRPPDPDVTGEMT
jgi:hypothetical protein